jgi:microcystin degradation protein MlrC
MRVLIAMMKHETNTFSPIITDWARFESWGAHEGDQIPARYENTRMPIAAYMKLARARGADIITPLATESMPSGPVEHDTYERMADVICDAVRAGCDVALLDLHGAMVARQTFDGEGTLLARMRAIAPDLPIAVTCDLHCNLTDDMVNNSTAIIGYKTYPHIDMYEVAEQIAQTVLDDVDGQVKATTSWGRSQVLSQTLCQGTDDKPMRPLIEKCRAAELNPKVLAATVFGGFALADIPDAGSSVVVVTDGDQALADSVRDDLLSDIWKAREAFAYKHRPLSEALAEARSYEDGPTILLDHADNCGSGATQDVMTVIEAVLNEGLEDVVVAALWDPQAVQLMAEKGVGNAITLALGGKTDMPSIGLTGRPVKVTGRVKSLTDGRWTVHGPMYTGVEVDMGPSAVLDTGAMQIVIVSRHHEPWDLGVFTSMGISPERHRYILLKSRIHYRAGFGTLPRQTLTLDGDGVTTSDNDLLDYQHLRRPMFPLDRINEP